MLAIQETKLNNSNRDSEFYIPGFFLVRRERISDGGGVVCFYIKSSIIFCLKRSKHSRSRKRVHRSSKTPIQAPYCCQAGYRPPNSPVRLYSHLENLIRKVDLINFDFLLLGDMTADMATTNFDNDARQLLGPVYMEVGTPDR